MAAVSLFWYTNMAAVTSCEITLFGSDCVLVLLGEKLVIFHSWEIRVFANMFPFFGKLRSQKRLILQLVLLLIFTADCF